MDQQVNQMFNQDRLIQYLGAHLISITTIMRRLNLKCLNNIYRDIRPVTAL
jgi:hypothetical protein